MSGESPTILMLCPDFPYPPDMGSRIDMWGHVQFFRSQGWRIVLAVCMTPDVLASRGDTAPAFPFKLECHIIRRNNRWACDEPAKATADLQKIVDEVRPRVIWCEYADMANLAGSVRLDGIPLWFRPHNFELAHSMAKAMHDTPWRGRTGFRGPSPAWQRLVRQIDLTRRIRKSEGRMHRLADRLFYISFTDLKYMKLFYPGKARRDWVLPLVDMPPVPVKSAKEVLDVVYQGSDYANNVNLAGARKLLDEIVPAVRKALPGRFRFHLTGKGGDAILGPAPDGDVIVHGFVEHMRSFLADMDCSCVPVELGWGCKLKVIDAMASGIPLIGSPQAFRGVPITRDGPPICRTVQDYVSALTLLLNPDERRRQSEAGMSLYESWRTSAESILREALAKMPACAGSLQQPQIELDITK